MDIWQKVGVLALGGGLGTLARYFISDWSAQRWGTAFPWGTLIVNVTGSLVLGLVLGLATGRSSLSPQLRLLLASGFLGAFTTFSTWTYETTSLAGDGSYLRAAANLLGSVAAGLLAVWLGMQLGKAL